MTTAPMDGQLGVRRGRRLATVLGAVAFPAFFLALDPVTNLVAADPLPLPNAPRTEFYQYLAANTTAVVLTCLLHVASVVGLLTFILASRGLLPRTTRGTFLGTRVGLLAVASLSVSALLGFLLAGTASSLSVDTVYALRTANFITGGVGHVVAIGVYVWLTRRAHTARGIRIFGAVAVVPALLSLVSLVWFYANAFILIGRVLCMTWVVAAGITLAFAGGRGLKGAAAGVRSVAPTQLVERAN